MKRLIIFLMLIIFNQTGNSQWIPSGLQGIDTRGLAINSSGMMFASTAPGYVYRSTNNGSKWIVTSPLLYTGLDLDIAENDYIYLTTTNGLYRSTDNGTLWELSFGPTTSVNCLEILPNGNLIIGVLGQGPYISTNNGANWFISNSGLAQSVISLKSDRITNDIYAGTYYDGVYKSTNSGVSWFRSMFFDEYVFCFAAPGNGDIYTGVVGYSKIFKSNSGNDWQQVFSAGSQISTVEDLLPLQNGNILAGINGSGIFLTSDNGASWNPINDGLGSTAIFDLSIDSLNYVFASTADGIYKRSFVTGIENTEPASIPYAYELYQNSPNPFNPSTKISFDVSKPGFITLEVFDMAGRLIERLINEQMTPGSYSVSFYRNGLPSGAYFYRLISNDFSKTLKMVLLK